MTKKSDENNEPQQTGEEIFRQNLCQHLGEEKLRKFQKTVLRLLSELDLPCMRGTFFEVCEASPTFSLSLSLSLSPTSFSQMRNGMVNISPIGRNCSQEERDEFEKYDHGAGVRKTMVATLEKEFGAGTEYNLKFSVGGQISFDAFPVGWDKTYSLRFVEKDFAKIHFFGDKTYEGGNDYEIFVDERTEGHSVTTYTETITYLKDNLIGK